MGETTIDIALPATGTEPSELGVVVNLQDPQSVAVGTHYLAAHRLHPSQRLEVSFPPGAALTPATVNALKQQLDADAGAFEALLITWTTPWDIQGMSVTSALTLVQRWLRVDGNVLAHLANPAPEPPRRTPSPTSGSDP